MLYTFLHSINLLWHIFVHFSAGILYTMVEIEVSRNCLYFHIYKYHICLYSENVLMIY